MPSTSRRLENGRLLRRSEAVFRRSRGRVAVVIAEPLGSLQKTSKKISKGVDRKVVVCSFPPAAPPGAARETRVDRSFELAFGLAWTV